MTIHKKPCILSGFDLQLQSCLLAPSLGVKPGGTHRVGIPGGSPRTSVSATGVGVRHGWMGAGGGGVGAGFCAMPQRENMTGDTGPRTRLPSPSEGGGGLQGSGVRGG